MNKAEEALKSDQMAGEIDMKDSSAVFSLANCYDQGVGKEKSLEKADYYYKLAGDNGFSYGYFKAAKCYLWEEINTCFCIIASRQKKKSNTNSYSIILKIGIE